MQQKLASQNQINSLLDESPSLKVWKCIKDNDRSSPEEIMRITKMPQATVYRLIKKLLKLNLIGSEKCHIVSKKSRAHRYRMTYFSKVKGIKL